MKVDFHVHTKYSHDCSAEIGEILQYARRHGLDAIAIADHDSLEGSRLARQMRTSSDVEIIPAIEFTLPAGDYGVHIVALNMDEYIAFDDITGAIEQMKRCGATIVLPHPFRRGTGLLELQRQGYVSGEEVRFVLENINYVEALNLKDDCEAVEETLRLVAEVGYPIISGTDAHHPEYTGMTYTTVSSLEDFFSGRGKGMIGAYVKKDVDAELDNLHEILETGNDSHYASTDSRGRGGSWFRMFGKSSSNGRADERSMRFKRCAKIAEVFQHSATVGLERVDGQLRIMCGSKV